MTIERKFKMFSTKEWIQYLQYKLSPEREKELEAQLSKDPFLSEAVAIIGDKENRTLSYQSITSLINEVQQYTGVSESKIAKSKENENLVSIGTVNWKLIGIVMGGAVLLAALGYLIFYVFSTSVNSENEETTMVEAESVSTMQSYSDSSNLPLETIPNTSPTLASTDSSLNSTTPRNLIKKKQNQETISTTISE